MTAEAAIADASNVEAELLGPPRLLRGALEYRLARPFAVTMIGFGNNDEGRLCLALSDGSLTPIGGSVHVISRPYQAFRPVSFLGAGALGWRCDELRIGNRLAFTTPIMFDEVFAEQKGRRLPFSFETVQAAMDVSLRATNVDAGGDAGRTWFLLLDDALWWFRAGIPPVLVGRELASSGLFIHEPASEEPIGDISRALRRALGPDPLVVQLHRRVDGTIYAIDERSDLPIFDTTGRPRLNLGGIQ